ncbi:hypothetical protein DOTSEDRAFT_56085 [Lecanosticta acicola]|uniref:GH16 domain-containing protein n=1 Tax=Lecanosticta acicola TaxID=111012 RepID=A0AAI8YU10_9PEZI|nr:hypothetical protein DOTSEDRAFT_56085 [Lecanosticta acicola]
MLCLVVLPLLWRLVEGANSNVTLASDCSCGFQDPTTKDLFTDSIILYFNETGVDTNVFEIRNYQNKNQKGWNTVFKQGARPSNVWIGNNDSLPWQDAVDGTQPSLEMYLDALDQYQHRSQGAELRSLRRDILYGTFRASMRSAQPWVGGSAMSMYLQYNSTQQLYLDLLNMDSANAARVMQTINGEWPDNEIAVNYTLLQEGDPPKIPPLQPWDFLDTRIDWGNRTVDFWIGQNRTRHVTKDDRTLPTTPESLYLSHWSTGDANYMQGPPPNRTVANVRWIRAFFNSSTMTADDHKRWDQKCNAEEACSIDDVTLRGSTAYSPASTVPWELPVLHSHIRTAAGYVAAAFSCFGIAAILNALVRRGPWYRLKNIRLPGTQRESLHALRQSLRRSMPHHHHSSRDYPLRPLRSISQTGLVQASGSETPVPGYTFAPNGYTSTGQNSGTMTPLPPYEDKTGSPWQPSAAHSRKSSSINQPQSKLSPSLITPSPGHLPAIRGARASAYERETDVSTERNRALLELGGTSTPSDDEIRPAGPSLDSRRSHSSAERREMRPVGEEKQGSFMDLEDGKLDEKANDRYRAQHDEGKTSFHVAPAPQDESVARVLMQPGPVPDAMIGAASAEPRTEQPAKAPNQPQQRIDYLAGLVAICCVMVTARHFTLTFWPYIPEAQGEVKHFAADEILSPIFGPFILTPLWIGPFFVTSCRFLAQRYLRTGKLNDVANKMLLRAPRMLIPCFVFITLEYFLISLGLTSRLQWLPSVSYSTWPYVVPQPNFGVFLNEGVELAYITPNAAPEIINHYCVGVLWTIPVQLQFSFVTLLATVLIRDVKKPWKRMLFYTLTIVLGWYANSWSACHWLGLLLADADITYNWIKWTQARWWRLYPVLFLAAGLAATTPLINLFNSDIYYFSFSSWENGIRPDPTTGRPILETVPSIYYAYPPYYTPSLSVLTFSAGLQVCVELSTWAQKFLSMKVITFFHPHIMTIYLIHGFIFWSLGSYTAVALSSTDLPYWAILIIIALVCYTVIFLVTVLTTPMIEFATKGATKNIWRWATEAPVPHRNTTAPFTKAIVLDREGEAETAEGETTETKKGWTTA